MTTNSTQLHFGSFSKQAQLAPSVRHRAPTHLSCPSASPQHFSHSHKPVKEPLPSCKSFIGDAKLLASSMQKANGMASKEVACTLAQIKMKRRVRRPAAGLKCVTSHKKAFAISDFAMSSLRGGHANLLCIIPIFSDASLDAQRFMRCCRKV